jgi:hypothetical protein
MRRVIIREQEDDVGTLDPDIATSGSAAMAKTAFAILKSFLPDCEKVLPGLKLNREAQVRQ